MRVLNIVQYLPIKGFPAENDITLKIYSDLKKKHGVESLFVMPVAHIPKWASRINMNLFKHHKIINNKDYIDNKYGFKINFFKSFLPTSRISKDKIQDFYYKNFQFPLYKRNLYADVLLFKPDLIHAHTIQDAFYAYKIYKKFNIPYIITLRGVYSDLYNLKLSHKILKNARDIVTPSFALKEKIKKRYKIELLPHGLDRHWFLKGDNKFDTNTIQIVTVSKLSHLKNIDLIIKAVYILKQQNYKIQYSIIGEGVLRNELENLVDKLNLRKEIIFYGFKSTEEIKEIFKASNIFVMLSYPETFGRVYFEAAAQGLLIIGREGTGAYGYFIEKEAFFIDSSESKLASVLKKVNKQLFDEMTTRSRFKVKDFENDRIINKYFNILKRYNG